MLNSSESHQIKNQFNSIKIIYYALVTGLITFFAVTLFVIQNRIADQSNDLDSIFTIAVPLFGLMMMFISRTIYSQMSANYKSSNDLSQKIEFYRKAKIVSWALVEAGCLCALVATILTVNYLYVAVFILLFGYFIMMKPSVESFVQEMRLNSKESDLIRGN